MTLINVTAAVTHSAAFGIPTGLFLPVTSMHGNKFDFVFAELCDFALRLVVMAAKAVGRLPMLCHSPSITALPHCKPPFEDQPQLRLFLAGALDRTL